MPGSTVNSTRLGRGPGNKKGKTAGRGTKGQNARAGGGNAYFEGGQTPIHIRFPKIGHNTSYASSFASWKLIVQETMEFDAGQFGQDSRSR